MSGPQGNRLAESPSCPLLGLPDDPLSRFSYPSVAHRCRAEDRPRPIDLNHQGAFCLAAMYPECPRYRAAAASRRPGAAIAKASGVALERARAEAGAPGGHGRQPPGLTSRRRRVAATVLVGAVLAGAAYLAGPTIVDWMRQVGAGVAVTSPSRSTPPPATPVPTPATPAPMPTATRAPTATPSPTRTPARTPAATPQIHVVVRGETLGVIAARYGVTVAAIQKANGITDPGLIYVGQHLVIPPP
jgi:LysM repeat protein